MRIDSHVDVPVYNATFAEIVRHPHAMTRYNYRIPITPEFGCRERPFRVAARLRSCLLETLIRLAVHASLFPLREHETVRVSLDRREIARGFLIDQISPGADHGVDFEGPDPVQEKVCSAKLFARDLAVVEGVLPLGAKVAINNNGALEVGECAFRPGVNGLLDIRQEERYLRLECGELN